MGMGRVETGKTAFTQIPTFQHSIEAITKTVNASWKVQRQTAKVSCQGKCRNISATCCLNQRIASDSVGQIEGQTLQVNTQ